MVAALLLRLLLFGESAEEEDDFERNFRRVFMACTRRDASCMLTPGTGDSVIIAGGGRGAALFFGVVPLRGVDEARLVAMVLRNLRKFVCSCALLSESVYFYDDKYFFFFHFHPN